MPLFNRVSAKCLGRGLLGKVRARFLSRAGQIVIPAVFLIPTLMLFVYLIFETAKLSREKIRHQFAVDSASFVEMVNLSDFLNRTAYVNGPFPHRIFKEAFSCPPNENKVERTDSGTECLYDILYEHGAFPKFDGDDSTANSLDKWPIKFGGTREAINTNPPNVPNRLELISKDKAIRLILSWEAALGIYRLYAQVYLLLGSVEESQKSVYERLTERFNFYRKSYYLNTGECQDNPETCGESGLTSSQANSFNQNKVVMNVDRISVIYFAARRFVGGLDPLKVVETENGGQVMPQPVFQVAYTTSDLKKIGNGLEVFQDWKVTGDNFFKVNVNSLATCRETSSLCVHARIASQCPQLMNTNNCVWPYPTPKYQTRLYP